MDSRLNSKFFQRAKKEFDKKPEGSYFLNVDLIRKYPTTSIIAIPTASEEVTFDIDEYGNLCRK